METGLELSAHALGAEAGTRTRLLWLLKELGACLIASVMISWTFSSGMVDSGVSV